MLTHHEALVECLDRGLKEVAQRDTQCLGGEDPDREIPVKERQLSRESLLREHSEAPSMSRNASSPRC
jgi:hypothetical protein